MILNEPANSVTRYTLYDSNTSEPLSKVKKKKGKNVISCPPDSEDGSKKGRGHVVVRGI